MIRELKNTFIALVFLLLAGSLEASPIDDLRQSITDRESQIKQIEAEINAFQQQIEAKEAEANTLKNEISKQDTILKKLAAQINLTSKKISASELILKRLSLEIGGKNEEIDSHKLTLAQILRSMNETDKGTLIQILLKHNDLSDFFSDVQYIQDFEEAIKNDLDNLKVLKADLEENKKEEEQTKKRLISLASDLRDQKGVEENVRKAKDQLLRQTKNKEAEYQKLVSDRQKKRAEILSEINKIEDQLRAMIDPTSLPELRPGVLAWPIQPPLITQGFGLTSFAKSAAGDVYGSNGHNGIDFKAAVGTTIIASEDGVVKSVGNSDLVCPGGSYGRWVLIEHPNNLATLYAHLSYIKVGQGQNVSRGEIIAFSGDTGYTTGPHLHFTVYDARTVQYRKSRVCGTLPYGGYLDPTKYL